ncbi:hypothetical protein [Limnoglobus roseus]|uniref:Uncharacterized protein n=1 Tax=Limnoglobus roseus TaxID=2598579 RepID=A0A5C1AR58_9BACT|nr:hypothetical protein [Limnoglobus roseus]QEL20687.1 hypothetical protein PX52LOC_07794 [Limnoglobus roseus]
MRAPLSCVVLVVLLVAEFAVPPAAADEPTLAAADKKYLDGLMADFLFDPKGAERVAVPVVVRTVWATADEGTTEGWLVPAKDGKPGRVHFTDGASIPIPPDPKVKKVDFVAACKARYTAPAPKKGDADDDTFRKMGKRAVGGLDADDLAVAAWLYRLGQDGLAARALAAARKEARAPRGEKGDPRKQLREDLAWAAFAGLVHAYMVRADEEALAHGERLLNLYPTEAKDEPFDQATAIVADLKRRRGKGTFGKAPAETWPDGFDTWNAARKATYLIDALDEVDARQDGQPGGVDLAGDRRVRELIRVGDASVPALIDALEKDERLTRSVHFWRDFARSRTVLGVREAELSAVMSILRVRVFEPVSTGDSFTARGGDTVKATVARLRAYWTAYGRLPFDERMMAVLTDPKASFEAKREAAGNLARLGADRTLATTVFSDRAGDPPGGANPAVAKFKAPTVAEAILAAMDADLAAHDAKKTDDLHDYHRRHLEDAYLFALVDLGDKRAAADAAGRTKAATGRMRRKWAFAAHLLGNPEPFRQFADEFRRGLVAVPANDKPRTNDDDQPGAVELAGAVGYLVSAGTPEADAALNALADPKHPLHRAAADRVLKESPGWSDHAAWFAHPYCLRILRAALDDTTPTGATYAIEGARLRHKVKDGESSGPAPDFLSDPTVRRAEAAERACDKAAEQLAALVVGLPRYHPLFKDADARLAAVRAAFDRFAGNYRRATGRERDVLDLSPWGSVYVPNVAALGRAATADDVRAGRAVFHLDGKGTPADRSLPAAAGLKKDEKQERPPRVVIVQAEVGPDGETTFGVIAKDGVRARPERELTGIKSFVDLDREAKEAAKKRESGKE